VRMSRGISLVELNRRERGNTGDSTPGKCTLNVEVTGAARLYRAAPVWTAGLGGFNESFKIATLPAEV